jgi:hypothetical protein
MGPQQGTLMQSQPDITGATERSTDAGPCPPRLLKLAIEYQTTETLKHKKQTLPFLNHPEIDQPII